MAQANERKGVLHHLGLDRVVSALVSGGRTFGDEDSSEPASPGGATGDRRTTGDGVDDAATKRILTPEERIVEMLEENGGRMKQAEVVRNVEWSESTVSRKLQRLESTGEVTRYQLGREKLVYLPGEEPAALDSPFAGDVEGVSAAD